MKKKSFTGLLPVILVACLSACGSSGSSDTSSATSAAGSSTTSTASAGSTTTTAAAAVDESITATETTGDFSVTTDDGVYASSDGIVTISSAGTYTLQGLLEGQIVVEAGEEDDITLELSNATIKYGKDSPIKVVSAGNVDISAKSDTENIISDERSAKASDDESQGEGAIYAGCDLKIKGTGTLVINAAYNNGIHTTKDLTIQKLSLKVTAYGNALKGNDSVTVLSGNTVAVSTNGDGIKTQNTDADKSGNTRGDVTISGGSVSVYAAGDGIQAAHSFELSTGEAGTAPSLSVYTGSYSSYTADGASTTSYKGIKVQDELRIIDGSISVMSYDDALHADYGTAFDDGTTGQGIVTISGGAFTTIVYSPENKTANGNFGPGGWGNQQTVSGADAIHSDNVINISGGQVNIDSSYEGIEANQINISGGKTYVAANDDGINATSGNATPAVNITGGYLDVTVNPNADTDGIDSNGTYTQSGGIVIARGPNNEMSAALDADGTVLCSGGTVIILGYGRPQTESGMESYSLSLHSEGSHTATIDGTSYTITNAYSYGQTICYSDVSVTD